jgi:hypothetical protein
VGKRVLKKISRAALAAGSGREWIVGLQLGATGNPLTQDAPSGCGIFQRLPVRSGFDVDYGRLVVKFCS